MNRYTEGTAWAVAFVRGLVAAGITGGAGFLAVWSTTNDVKTLIIAGLGPFIAALAVRFGVEGAVDSRVRPGP